LFIKQSFYETTSKQTKRAFHPLRTQIFKSLLLLENQY